MDLPNFDELANETGVRPLSGETLIEYVHRLGSKANVPDDELKDVKQVYQQTLYLDESDLSESQKVSLNNFLTKLSDIRVDSENSGMSDRGIKTSSFKDDINSKSVTLGEQIKGTSSSEVLDGERSYTVSKNPTFFNIKRTFGSLSRNQIRLVIIIVLLLAVIPLGVEAITYVPPSTSDPAINESTNDLLVFTVQGGETGFGAGIYILQPESKQIIWKHTDYFRKYFDVDPLNKNEVLFIAQKNRSRHSFRAIRMNWRTGTVIEEFPVPPDTHDVDLIGNNTYVVADKTSVKSGGSRIYEYRPSEETIIWEFKFANHYPATAGNGLSNDYTHLNDVDLVNNGTAYLASPRNFDRVVLINKSNKEIVWELGEEDDYEILHEQHNPVLLDSNPPTVLVADSHNARAVEYEKTSDGWKKTWEYKNWPWTGWIRDADRLPNGNTLMVGSGQSRLLEVTPNGEIVWKMDISNWAHSPYDIERLELGDEPSGPRMEQIREDTLIYQGGQKPSIFDLYYRLLRWLLPPWVSKFLFIDIHILIFTMIVWISMEFRWRRPLITPSK